MLDSLSHQASQIWPWQQYRKKLVISVFPKKSEQIQLSLFSYNLLFGVFVYLISSF